MELCDGDLADFCRQHPLGLKTKIDILCQIAKGMEFLHENRIIHKDLKPQNVLVKNFEAKELQAKITDFGLSYPVLEDESDDEIELEFGGTRSYMSPEMIRIELQREMQMQMDNKIDVWAFGVVTYKLITGEHPFKHLEDTLTFNAKQHIEQYFEQTLNQDFKELLIKILDQDPSERPSMKAIRQTLTAFLNLTDLALKETFSPSGYTEVRLLGEGGFGKVFLYMDNGHNKIAVKKMNESMEDSHRIQRELDAMLRLQHHENIVDVYYHTVIDNKVHIYMELCEGSLKELLEKEKLPRKTKMDILVQIANGLSYIHVNRIIHKDLKPGNVLIKDFIARRLQAKITDFGLSYPIMEDQETTTVTLSYGGSPAYIAPELGGPTKGTSYKVDVWSFGVVTYKVLLSKHPDYTIRGQAAAVITNDFGNFGTQEFKDIFIKMFNLDPTLRPTMKLVHEKYQELYQSFG